VDRDLDSAHVLVAPGGVRITYLVSPADKPRYGECPSPLTNENRYQLRMEMLGIDAKHMPWMTQGDVTISWEGKEKYLDTLCRYAEVEQGELPTGLRLFVEKG
jgi:hypothetical protein